MKASFWGKHPAAFLAWIEQITSGLYSDLSHMHDDSEQFGQVISHMLSQASPAVFFQVVLIDTGSVLFMTIYFFFLNHCSLF